MLKCVYMWNSFCPSLYLSSCLSETHSDKIYTNDHGIGVQIMSLALSMGCNTLYRDNNINFTTFTEYMFLWIMYATVKLYIKEIYRTFQELTL